MPWHSGTMAVAQLDHQRQQLLDVLPSTVVDPDGPTMPAILRYSGVLYRELDPSTLRGRARVRLNRDLLVVSGLWGLVAPQDPIPTYRLKMSARVEETGRLASWWRPYLTISLAPRVRRAVVWDLLPGEHSAAVDWSELAPARRVTIRFVDRSGKTVSHWNKLLKGSLVRWLAETGARVPEDLTTFEHPRGYVLDEDATVWGDPLVQVVMREQDRQGRPG